MGKKRIFLIVSFLFLISLINFISSLPSDYHCTDNGISFGFKDQEVIQQGNNYTFTIHPYNSSDGSPLSNTTSFCAFHLYNSVGSHILINNDIPFGFSPYDFYLSINGNNFTNTGYYPYVVTCFDNDGTISGTCSGHYLVTKSGKTISFNLFLPLVVILFFSMLCFIFGVTSKENKIMKYTLFSLAVVMAYVGIQYTLIVVQEYSLIGETEGGLGFFLIFFQAITWIIGGIFTLTIIWLFIQLRKWFNIKKGFIDGGNYK